MPTPFQHLDYAERVSGHPILPSKIRDVLAAASGAYLLGNVAPDIRTITGQSRAETHFYHLNQAHKLAAADRFLATYPEFGHPCRLSPEQAAFVSGYVVHLTWDEVWARDIFLPFFRHGPAFQRGDSTPDRLSYFLHHNALRALLDRRAYATLRSSGRAAALLRGAGTRCGTALGRRSIPGPCLPFVDDETLSAWRDFIVEQLDDPGLVRTIDVFAERMGLPVSQVADRVEAMDAGSYAAIPGLAEALVRYEHCGMAAALRTLLQYWEIEDRLEAGEEAVRASCKAA